MRTWTKPAELAAPRLRGELEISLTCRFISPVFGGGVDPKLPDPVTPVRASAIRGHLRFWWRATHADLSLDELRARELALFGGVHGDTPRVSAVSICVAKQPPVAKRIPVFVQGNAFKLVDDRLGALAYGAFPLRGSDPAKTHGVLFVYDAPFDIALRARAVEGVDVHRELDRALWAWLHFGGLGARTRRGFGAVELVPAPGWTLKGIGEGWPTERRRPSPEWATLQADPTSVVRARSTRQTGREAQELLLDLLRRMRQGDLGRKQNHPRPGRSYWPEPDAIRKIYGVESGRHATPIHTPRIDKFPRAAFGAPIIFHFKSEPGEREPPDSTLAPARRVSESGNDRLKPFGRLASPLVLRPHASGGGRYEAMALHLAHPSPEKWVLLARKDIKAEVAETLEANEARRVKPLLVNGRSYTDPIAAYLAYLATI